jgi:hypothetical protein
MVAVFMLIIIHYGKKCAKICCGTQYTLFVQQLYCFLYCPQDCVLYQVVPLSHHSFLSYIYHSCFVDCLTDTPTHTQHSSIMPHLERGPSEFSFLTRRNESATPSSMELMPSNAVSPDVKSTFRSVLQNREQEKGIQLTHTYRPQKYAKQTIASEYIADGAKTDDTSACIITSPPIAVSPDFKRLPQIIS